MKTAALTIISIGVVYLLLPLHAQAESKSLALLWQNRDPSAPYGQPFSIDAAGHIAVAAGIVATNAFDFNTNDWFVRAYDTSTGVTLWEDRIDPAGLRDEARAVVVHGDRAFVVGNLQTSLSCTTSMVIRAYALKTGSLLWQRSYDCGTAGAIAADGGQVFVVGTRVEPTTFLIDGAIVALDAQTGTTQWEVKTESTADPILFPQRSAVDTGVYADGDRVFVAGQMLVSSGNTSSTSMYVQAYERTKGTPLWQHVIPDASVGPTFSVPLVVEGEHLVVGGAATNPNPNFPWDYRVTMLDKRTGVRRWDDQVHRQAGGLSAGFGFGAGKLFAYGWDCNENVFNCHGDIRAYDPDNGKLLWENRFTGPGGDIVIPIPGPAPFVVKGNDVYLGTALLDQQGDEYQWTVRYYDGRDGSVRAQSQTYDGGGLGDGIVSLKMLGDRLFAAGYTDRPDGGYDFAVRAYQTDCDK